MMQSAEYNKKTGKQGLWNRLKRFMRFWYLRVVRIQATPHNIALGLAAGIFVGLLPVLPFQTVLAIALAFIVRGSKIAAALGTWVTNPANWLPFYLLCYKVGKALVPFDIPPFRPSELEMAEMLQVGWKFFAAMMAGGLIMAIPGSLIAYFVGKKLIRIYQTRRVERRCRKAQKLLESYRAPRD